MNTTTATNPHKTSPVGTWTITAAKTTDETPYFGTVQIHQMGEIYSMSWLTTLGDYPGIAFFENGNLYAACSADAAYGVSLYQINSDGTLDGKWATGYCTGIVETEKAVGGTPNQVAGTYNVQGTFKNTSIYEGVLQVTSLGEIYQVSWLVGHEYKGVGLQVNDQLIVAWGEGTVFGLHYQIEGDRATGNWAMRESTTLGTESLYRIC
ncbi:hypothetical protein [Floridanema evergladense]|uniref:Uncharacterized protein n=1 Tax=Floridaenema evergladense BLCC-F167 TaxID=3153639 RepID=A0ABV4WVC3_9CYAN